MPRSNCCRTFSPIVVCRCLLGLTLGIGLLLHAVGCDRTKNRSLFPQTEAAPLSFPTTWHQSFEEASAVSRETGKPMLVNFTGSDWCSFCVKLKSEVFETAEFEKWGKQNVVLVEIDYPKRSPQSPKIKAQNQELAKRFNITSYPTVLLMTAEGEVLGDRLGYDQSPNRWIAKADGMLDLSHANSTRIANQQLDASGTLHR